MFDIKPANCWPYVANDLKVMDKTLGSHNGMRMLHFMNIELSNL